MGQGAAKDIDQADRFELEGVEFVPSWTCRSTTGSLVLVKSARMVPRYRELLAPFSQVRMVELGISQGGSVALLALLARPEKFVAIDLDPTPVQPLLDVLEEKGLADSVRPYFGVDQSDRRRLVEIVTAEFGNPPLDVVVDDASHLYDPTVASFEVLFPRLAPGGIYVIEDWTCKDVFAESIAQAVLADTASGGHHGYRELLAKQIDAGAPVEPPISRLALELALAAGQSDGAVSEVRIDDEWILVRRGERPLDPEGFRITDLYQDHFHQLGRRPTDVL